MHKLSYDEETGMLELELPDYADEEEISPISVLFVGLYRRLKTMPEWVAKMIEEEAQVLENESKKGLH